MTVKRLTTYESDEPRNNDWHIMLCMNDHNGNESGIVTQIEVSTIRGDFAEFYHWNRGAYCKIDESGFVKLGRKKFNITGINYNVGNIFWNLITVKKEVGENIMRWIKQNPFECDGGTVAFLKKYHFE